MSRFNSDPTNDSTRWTELLLGAGMIIILVPVAIFIVHSLGFHSDPPFVVACVVCTFTVNEIMRRYRKFRRKN
jgi:hypothetical protein